MSGGECSVTSLSDLGKKKKRIDNKISSKDLRRGQCKTFSEGAGKKRILVENIGGPSQEGGLSSLFRSLHFDRCSLVGPREELKIIFDGEIPVKRWVRERSHIQ